MATSELVLAMILLGLSRKVLSSNLVPLEIRACRTWFNCAMCQYVDVLA